MMRSANRVRILAGLCLAAVLTAREASTQAPSEVLPDLPGSTGQILSPARAIELFRRGNLELVAARYDLEATRADIIAAGVLPNPTLGLGVAVLTHGQPQGGKESYQITVDQVVPVAGQVGLRKDVARGYASAAERDFAAAAWSLVTDVRDAYADLQYAQTHWRVLKAGMTDLGKVETIITERAAAGANPDYDRIRVVVERSNLLARVTEATAALATTRVALAQAIGKNVETNGLVVDDEVPEPLDPPQDIERTIARALAQRPEVQAAHIRTSAANLRISQVRREYTPSPDVQVGYNYWTNLPYQLNDGRIENRTGSALLVGVGIALPLFDHGQGKLERAAAEEQAFRVRAQSVELGIRRETVRAVQTMKARVESWRIYRDTTSGQVQRLRTIAESAYREGKTGILELLDAYRAYLESRERALELRSAAWKSSLAVERTLGPSPDQPVPGG